MRTSSYNDIMLDIETLGKDPFCAIVAIAAVEFDIRGKKTGREFFKRITPKSCEKAGLIIEADTVEWWLTQSEEARKALFNNKDAVSIQDALNSFTPFMKGAKPKARIWANSHSFDCNHVQEAYQRVLDESAPWRYNQPRCFRTIMDFYFGQTPVPEGAVLHNPLVDCHVQIEKLRLAISSLGLIPRAI